MPIKNLQAQWRQLGRIRIGEQVEGRGGKRRPQRLDTFRLTSPSKELLDRAAEVYGGEVKPWTEGGRREYELITTTAELDIVVPPGETVSQYLELWAAGGCVRRCDGETELLSGDACKCDPDPAKRECKPTSRLSVILPKLPDVGIWRADTSSYYAAVELMGTVNLLRGASEAGRPIPAKLRIDQREIKRPNEPKKQFAVLAIAIPQTMAELIQVGVGATAPQLSAGSGNGEGFVPVVAPASPQAPGWGNEVDLPEQAEPLVRSEPETPPADAATGEVLDDLDFGDGPDLTLEAFWALMADNQVPQEYIQEAGRALVAEHKLPADKTLRGMTDAQRGLLAAAIVQGLAKPVAS